MILFTKRPPEPGDPGVNSQHSLLLTEGKNFVIINGFVQFMLQMAELLSSDSEILGTAFYLFYSYAYQANHLQFDLYVFGVAALFLSHKLNESIRNLEDVVTCYLYLLDKYSLSSSKDESKNINRIKSFDCCTMKNLQKESEEN